MGRGTETVRLPKDVLEDLYEASLRISETLETLEVLLDKATIKRLKQGEKEYSEGKYVTARTREEARRVLLE